MLKHLPNALTLLRLVLTVPLGAAIVRQNFDMALAIGVIAGATDALDGFLARRLDAASRLGAALDPIADKALITVCFLCFAIAGLVPWHLALVVIARDLIIVLGAIAYSLLYGQVVFAATLLSKANMFVQIVFCVLLLLSQSVLPVAPSLLGAAMIIVLVLTVASGFDYVRTWSQRALRAHREKQIEADRDEPAS